MKTGWPAGLLQDDDRKLSRWLASRSDARYQLRKNIMKEDIIKMAQEAGWHVQGNRVFSPVIEGTDLLWLIERLVTIAEDAQAKRMYTEGMVTVGYMREQIAAEREQIIAANAPEIERVNAHIKELEDAVKAEREACARIAEEWQGPTKDREIHIAQAIRARGEA